MNETSSEIPILRQKIKLSWFSLSKLNITCCLLFITALLGIIVYRIHFSIDYYDESFYIAMAYHFVLGAKPFVDEYNLAQTVSLLTVPFFFLFHLLQGSTEGIVLFSRYLYLIVTMLFSLAFFFTIRRTVDSILAILIAATPLFFTPFMIYSVSYNSLGMLFSALSFFVLVLFN